MNTYKNKAGETITSWSSHIHPDNPNFMQVVKYMVIEKEGRVSVLWHLANNSVNDIHSIYGITKDQAIERYADKPVVELTEEDFQKWLVNNK